MPASISTKVYSFDLVLKVSERCNLACPYCYYYFQEFDGNKNPPIMNNKVIEALPEFIERSVKTTNINHFNIVIHGGEPLLMKQERIDRLCTVITEKVNALTEDIQVDFGIQTNGVLIDDSWIDLFVKHQIGVGVSLDGREEFHGKMRPDRHGNSSYEGAVRGMKLLQQAYADKRLTKIGALCTVHPQEAEHLLPHIIKELKVVSPGLNFPRAGWDTDEARIWDNQVAEYEKMVEYWLKELFHPVFHHVRGISDALLSIYNQQGIEKNDEIVIRRHHIATISSEGDVLVDDNLFGLDEKFSTSVLNVFEHNLADFLRSPIFTEMTTAIDSKPLGCEGCRWYRVCRGGAMYNRFSKVNGFKNKSSICQTLTMIYEKVSQFLLDRQLITQAQLDEHLATAPIMRASELVTEMLADKEKIAIKTVD